MNQKNLTTVALCSLVSLAGITGSASAEPPTVTRFASGRPMAEFHNGVWTRAPGTCGTIQQPPSNAPEARQDLGQNNVTGIQKIWLNRAGGTFNFGAGPSDSATNKVKAANLGVPNRPAAQITAFTGVDFEWPIVLKCVKDHFQKYNLTVTDGTTPPPAPYIESVIGGNDGSEIGIPDLFGVAATDTFCSFYDHGIAFVFEGSHHDAFNATYRNAELCNTIVHEVGHVMGLEHEVLANDNMSYVYIQDTASTGPSCATTATNVGTTCKTYLKQSSQCGYDSGHVLANCSCGGTSTNSGLRMETLIGLRPVETTPPELTVTGPVAGDLDSLTPTFDVVATATDNMAMDSVAVLVDGNEVGRSSTPVGDVYTIRVTGLAEAPHEMKVQAFDQAGNVTSKTLAIEVKLAVTGESCVDGTACHGGICAMQSNGNQFCTETCAIGGNSCPDEFSCKAAGDTSVCVPNPGTPVGMDKNDDDGGCSTSGSGPIGAGTMLALGLGLMITRRRK